MAWYNTVGDNIRVEDPDFQYDLINDKVVLRIDEPAYMTDRTREELRINSEGTCYLHTDSDRKYERIITSGYEVVCWAEEHKIKI